MKPIIAENDGSCIWLSKLLLNYRCPAFVKKQTIWMKSQMTKIVTTIEVADQQFIIEREIVDCHPEFLSKILIDFSDWTDVKRWNYSL